MQILSDALASYESGLSMTLVDAARSAFYGRSAIMSGRELRHYAKELYSISPMKYFDSDEFVQILLRHGVIGILEGQFAVRSSSMYRTGQFEHLIQDSLPLADRLTYCIHPVMSKVFNMKESQDGRVVYPLPSNDLWLERVADII
jgi:hypothetical protein